MYEFYYGTEAEQFNFIKIPRAFFTDKERFGMLSNEASHTFNLSTFSGFTANTGLKMIDKFFDNFEIVSFGGNEILLRGLFFRIEIFTNVI